MGGNAEELPLLRGEKCQLYPRIRADHVPSAQCSDALALGDIGFDVELDAARY